MTRTKSAIHTPSAAQISAMKVVLFLACLIPAALLAWGAYADTLGANPIEAITRGSGEWTLRFLLITLAVTPLRRLSGLHWVLRFRRMLGLYAFAYGCAHLLTYVWLDQFFDLGAIALDILKRPFITVGFAAFVLMTPLAITSNAYMIKRLGGRKWQSLHRSVYAIAIMGVVHFWWLVKKDLTWPIIYAVILAVLLWMRAWWRNQERERQLQGAYLRPPGPGRIIKIIAK